MSVSLRCTYMVKKAAQRQCNDIVTVVKSYRIGILEAFHLMITLCQTQIVSVLLGIKWITKQYLYWFMSLNERHPLSLSDYRIELLESYDRWVCHIPRFLSAVQLRSIWKRIATQLVTVYETEMYARSISIVFVNGAVLCRREWRWEREFWLRFREETKTTHE